MHASKKLRLLLCPFLLAPASAQMALAQAVTAAATQPATTLSSTTAPQTQAATQPDTSPATATAPATPAAEAATAPATQTADATTAPAPSTQTAATATAPATRTAATTTAPATQPAIVAVYHPGAKFTLNFKDTSLDAVLDYMSQAAGFVIIKDTSPLDGRITVLSRQPVSPEESITLLNEVLKTNGYTLIKNGRELHVTTREKAKKANLPVHFGTDPTQIPVTEDLITQVMPVSSVDATKLRTDLTPLLSTDADVTANKDSNTIIVTDTSANIHHIAEIITAVDQHQTAVNDIKVFKLKNASAAAAAKLITDIFKAGGTSSAGSSAAGGGGRGQRGDQGGGGGFRSMMAGFAGFGGPGGPGGSSSDAAFSTGTVSASSDDRTNTLVVSGPAETLKIIEGVVKEIDAEPTQTTTTFIYNLKNADATNLQNVMNNFFGMGSGGSSTSNRASPYTSGTTGSSFGGSSSGLGGSSSRSGSSGLGGSSSRSGSSGFGGSSSFGSSSSMGGGSSRGSSFGSSSLSSATARANSDLAGQVFVVADTGTNSLLVTAPAKDQARVTAMIDELDRAVPQVLIKVLIAEVTHTNGSDIGVEWSIAATRPSGKGTTGGTGFGIGSAIAAAAGAGGPNGMIVQIAEQNLSEALRLLANNNTLDGLSRPYILASDNQQASIMVGQSVPFVTGSDVTSVGTIINQVQYNDIGIILNVTPHINPDGLVILDVDPEVSSLSGQTVNIQAGVNAPVFNKRGVLSRVGIRDGQTVIIGGLMQDLKTSNVDKVPLLGDIPYLGSLFRHTTESKTKTELLIFLTPHVALQPDVLKGMSEQERAATKLVPSAVAPGVFDDHLHGMQIGSSTQPLRPRPSVVIPPGGQPPASGTPANPSGEGDREAPGQPSDAPSGGPSEGPHPSAPPPPAGDSGE